MALQRLEELFYKHIQRKASTAEERELMDLIADEPVIKMQNTLNINLQRITSQVALLSIL
jgi:hypothetical protein